MWSRSALFGILLWSGIAQAANDVDAFVRKFSDSQSNFQNTFDNSSAGFLKAIAEGFSSDGVFKELRLDPSLQSELLKLINEDRDPKTPAKTEVTFEDFQKIVKEKSNKLSDAQKKKLAALALVHLEKRNGGKASDKDALKALVMDYLEASAKLSPEEIIPLSEAWKKHLEVEDKDLPTITAAKLKDLIEKKGIPSEKEGLDLLTSRMDKVLEDPEQLRMALEPITKQLFNSLFRQAEPAVRAQLSGGDPRKNAEQRLEQLDNELAQSSQQAGNGPARSSGSGSTGGGGRRFRNQGPGLIPSGPSEGGSVPFALPGDDPKLKSCVELARSMPETNVPIRIPGGECASSALSKNPLEDKAEFERVAKKDPSAKVTMPFSTALHCVQDLRNLAGREIRLTIAGKGVTAKVVADINLDGSNGKAVAGGNPDMSVLRLELFARDAMNLSPISVPNKQEIDDMRKNLQVPLAIFQNSKINVPVNGRNGAVLAATGSMGENFMKFNANNDLNVSNNFDEQIIKPGDSGGTGATCRFVDNKATELLYAGAVSHVDVFRTGTGLVGGLSSGRSLSNLSKSFHGDFDSAIASIGTSPTSAATHVQ